MYLIIGASGFIGSHLYEACKRRKIDVCGTCSRHFKNPEWHSFNIMEDDLKEFCQKNLDLDTIRAVIICGANSSIDNCVKNEDISTRLNVTGTKRILSQADSMGIKSVFLSSEAVFDGTKGMYSEEDRPAPVHLYGRQKLQIEEYMMQEIDNYLILRLSRVVGSRFGEKDIFDDFYRKIVNQEEILCLKDQSFCLTEVNDVSQGILISLEKNIHGLYHLSSDNYISRFKLAELYARKVFGGYEKIAEKEYDFFHFLDQRQVHGGLKGDKLADLIGLKFNNLTEIIDRYTQSRNTG